LLRHGYRQVLLAGMLAIALGSASLTLLGQDTSLPLLMVLVGLIGLGWG